MLTRLELIGFKSFADKTRFDFAPGITAVVGPNGSGKSNIVDAVRWLLGEQSAKNLRGGEMTDVIFNGSSTRKSLGMAEVTMTFDNAARRLAADADEVQVTRRVYRDGEGEYLVNGQPARLKDIKDVFLGSGAGHGAYSIIEQGRVDALLSASTRDRRNIFEEAAGISRFKARKLEALRKLEDTDRNLSRVRDILQELDKQLRTLRLQAAKAQRYQEYHARLRHLRVGLGRREFADLTAALDVEEAVLSELRAELAGQTARAEAGEAEQKRLDWELARTDDALRHQEAKLADARQQIAGSESTARTEFAQAQGLEAELLRLGRQRADLGWRLRSVESASAQAAADLTAAVADADREEARSAAAGSALDAVTARIDDLSRQAQADREAQFDLVARSAKHHGDAGTARAQLDRLTRERDRKRQDADHAAARHTALDTALADLSRTDADLQQRLAATRAALAAHQSAQADLRQQADALQPPLDALRERRSALRGRADVLDGLERGLEGFGAGVRAVHARLAAGESPLAAGLVGLVADLLAAPRDVAPLVDLALGDAAQRFVARDAAALETVLTALGEVPGRVGIIPLGESPGTAVPGLLPTLDTLTRSNFPSLPTQLLGRTALAPDLPAARRFVADRPGFRAVTRTGELVEPDGTVVVGPPQSDAGLLSRKSELRDLRGQLAALDAEVAAAESRQSDLRRRADALDPPIRAAEAEIGALTGAAGSLRDQIVEQRQVQKQLAGQVELLRAEANILDGEVRRGAAALRDAEALAAADDEQAAAVKAHLERTEADLADAVRDRDARQAESTAAQVAVGRVREQVAALRKKRDELDAELRLRRIDGVNLASAERSARGRLLDANLSALRATATAAAAHADREERERQAADLSARRSVLTAARDAVAAALKQSRDAWQDRHAAAHARELTARDLRTRRDALAQRIREDFGVDLAEEGGTGELIDLVPAADSLDPPPSPLDPDKEIADLRRKIEKLGSVNLEALDELADVERRESDLRGQHDDLADAQKKLRAIIEQINADSRRLFTDTLATVRVHFQELFRKLFAGGQADIILEDEADVLESGIEITARPPGKELRKISLLSGGEKALTAVALLLAIFRSRPSPFCLLDEVDAAMDEGNTQRLAQLLAEFSDRTQFIVITHKKRTMAAADVLYGVTMQESGVSKPVAVRFDDWPDDEADGETAAA